ncbi:hypothetical protein [Pseudarthrobacter enclensis]|uniref:Uncharacterized protein n=1 Tax=Pseudarthrobacter enclensis TaxID=993070 RepID=A0ABT9RTW1_9MICC|nr:hypothetical protein [Pseudarthrobacter enclensis]MDP9887714.1 hypothetical protein [Pseudarthrobacter enclensis]
MILGYHPGFLIPHKVRREQFVQPEFRWDGNTSYREELAARLTALFPEGEFLGKETARVEFLDLKP